MRYGKRGCDALPHHPEGELSHKKWTQSVLYVKGLFPE